MEDGMAMETDIGIYLLEIDCHWDNSVDDIVLTQACIDIENKHDMSIKLDDMTLSQALDRYEVDAAIDDLPDFQANFDLKTDLTAENVIGTLEKAVFENTTTRYSFVEDSNIQTLVRSNESKNTRKNTNWSISTFNDWRVAQMRTTGCSIPDLGSFTSNDINQWFSKFVVEARRKDGKPYPPKTLYMLCVGLLRHLREIGIHFNFLDEKNSVFYEFRKALSARMSELTKQGVGTVTKQAEPLTQESENLLWERGILGDSNSNSILNTIFFYNSKLFGLRGVDEHRELSVDQISTGADQNGKFIMFNGRASKTYKGGLAQRHVNPKNIKHYCQNEVLYKIYEEYLGILSQLGGEAFYRRPSAKDKKFCVQAIGVNKLGTIIKKMCEEAGIEGYFTNHSGKRTCATVLYQAGVPEQEIMSRTGHRSVESVRKYKRPSTEMLRDISNILEPGNGIASDDVKKVKRENGENDVEMIEKTPMKVFNCHGCVFNFDSGSKEN